MGLETQQNHYQVLGLERSADERSIKKAYFALVRKFPPDTQPEDFKKIRAAYEVLSDPVARKRFDAADQDYAEYGESVGASLRAAATAAREGNESQAQQYLRVLLTQKPDLVVAREMLGQSYMRSENFASALGQFDELVKARPEEGRYHLWRGYALSNQQQLPGAEAAFRKARELRPDDVESRVALADSLAEQKRSDAAVAELEEALKRLPDEPGPRLHVELRRVDLLFMAKGSAAALRELDALVGRVRKDPDKEFWKYVSSQLAALAARLFGRSGFEDGNAVLARCARLNPGSPVEHPYPDRASLDLQDVSEKGRRWLAGREAGSNSPTFLLAAWGQSLWGLIAASALVVLTAFIFFKSPWAWGPAGYVFALLFFVGTAVALSASLRTVLAAATSPVHPLVTVHPLYLLQAGTRRLWVYPLVNLSSVNLTRHSTNGIYTHTAVEVKFGKRKFQTSIRNEGYAQGWADHLLQTRRRLLDLLHHGFLEAEPDVDLFPPRLLQSPARRFWRWPPRLDRLLLGGAAAGLLLFLLAIPWNRRLVEEAAFGAAARKGSVQTYAGYLRAHPTGRFADTARVQVGRLFADARSGLELAAGASAPGRTALLEGLRALEAEGQMGMPLLVTWETGPDAAAAAETDPALEEALSGASQTRRTRELAQRLKQAVAQAGLGEVAAVETKGIRPVHALGLRVRGRYGLDGSALEGGPVVLRGLRVSWHVTLTGTASSERFEWQLDTGAPDRLELDAARAAAVNEWQARAYEAELDVACADFIPRLATALGLGSSSEPVRTAQTARVSPYAR